MNIRQLSQKEPSFGQLYAPNKLRMFKAVVNKKQLLNSPSIKECATKHDVFVMRGEKIGTIETIQNMLIGGGIGLGLGTLVASGLSLLGVPTILGLVSILTSTFLGIDIGFELLFDIPSDSYIVKGMNGDVETKEHLLVTPEDLDNLPDLAKELEEKRHEFFIDTIAKKYPENGIFQTKNILEILKDKLIKRNFTRNETFNFNIDINKTSSLLMKFFEIKKTGENAKEYDKIASVIKSTPNINFNQQDNVGMSVIENIFNLENKDALDIVKDVEFGYTPYLDTLYGNIKDEEFKKKVKGLKIKFPDASETLKKTKSTEAFIKSLDYLESPLCNSRKEAIKIWTKLKKHTSPRDLKEINKMLYQYLPDNLRMD